jgi:protein-S-isoprenylcysteine O-methyltransferase Ste14
MAQMASTAVLLEKYLLPLFYFNLAWKSALVVIAIASRHSSAAAWGAVGLQFGSSLKLLLLFLLSLFSGLMLLANDPPARQPTNLRQILVPLVANLFFVTYDFVIRLPANLQANWSPPEWQADLKIIGLVLSVVGYGLALWSLVSLGKSFALIVSVRGIVLRGPYRFVRHPFYLGQTLVILGLAITYASIGMLIFNAIHMVLLVISGLMEERRLAEHSQEYRDYMKTAGFLFPKLDHKSAP